MKILRKSGILGISGLVGATAGIHWAVPVALGGGILSMGILVIFPEAMIAIFLYGFQLWGIALSGEIIAIMMIYICALTGMLARGRFRLPRIDLFQIALFLLLLWVSLSLLWTPNFTRGCTRPYYWLFGGILPLEIAIIMKISGGHFKRIPEITIYIGMALLILSALKTRAYAPNPMERFTLSGEEWNYARCVGFLLITAVWMLDKARSFKRMVFVMVIGASLYFLILSATRAPFISALFVSVAYLLLFSRMNMGIKIALGAALIVATAYMLVGSYMFMRFQNM